MKTSEKALLMPLSHGYHVVDDETRIGDMGVSIVSQCKQVGDSELWLFGVFGGEKGEATSNYLETHLHETWKEHQIWRKTKETMKKANQSTNAMCEGEGHDNGGGWTALMVMNRERLVIANGGNYKAVLCRKGMANHTGKEGRNGCINAILCRPNSAAGKSRVEKIDSKTEFVILASHGVWKVMEEQEAINLIGHMKDPQEASECLAKEALTRLCKGTISCLVVRFLL